MMRKLINLFKQKNLKWQLLTRLFALLIFLLIVIEVFQYFSLKQYLCKTKEEILESNIHKIEKLSHSLTSKENVIISAPELIENTIDMNLAVTIID